MSKMVPADKSVEMHNAYWTRAQALCHCVDCRKITGSTYSTNLVVGGEGFTSSGNPKTFTKTADSGQPITSFFCGNCGSTLWREGVRVIRQVVASSLKWKVC